MKREQEIALRAMKVAAAASSGDSEYSDSDYGGTSPRSPPGVTSKSQLSPSKMNISFSPENKIDGTVRKKRTKVTK